METKTAAVSMKNITKTFGPVIANDKGNLDYLERMEVERQL